MKLLFLFFVLALLMGGAFWWGSFFAEVVSDWKDWREKKR